jgi:23S rRNA pseudouridine1911/1915/1917 synthase
MRPTPTDAVDAEPEVETETLHAPVPEHLAGRRFDQALAEMFPEYSRSRLAEWIRGGDALLDGDVVRPRDPVRGGEKVTVALRTEAEVDAQPEAIALAIVYEDADVLVIDKPAGLVVHPGAGNPRGTLVNALLHFDARMAELPRAGIVHRLDKDTSGLMVVARSLRAHAALVEQLSAREVHRQYLAAVVGPMIAGGTVDNPIGRHATDRLRQAVVKEGHGREAVTHDRVRERFRAHTLVECRLETGRTHQIRVHLLAIGHPVVGDAAYGGQRPGVVLDRPFLHAGGLAFAHPVTGEPVAVEEPLAPELAALLETLSPE